MKKKELLVIRPSDDSAKIYKNLVLYLQKQGFKIVKGVKNGKK
jgi:hypothetical protein